MILRKFEITSIEEEPGGPGPDRAWQISYRAIVKKLWIERKLWVIAKNKQEAEQKALKRFGGKQ